MVSTMSVSVWAFAFSLCFGVSKCYFAIPLRIYTGSYNVSSAVDVSRRVVLTSDGNGLSLASDPTGTVNFLDMVNNLQGDSGRGYYIEMSLGTPGQKVMYYKHLLCVYLLDMCIICAGVFQFLLFPSFFLLSCSVIESNRVMCCIHLCLVCLLCVNRGQFVHHVIHQRRMSVFVTPQGYDYLLCNIWNLDSFND